MQLATTEIEEVSYHLMNWDLCRVFDRYCYPHPGAMLAVGEPSGRCNIEGYGEGAGYKTGSETAGGTLADKVSVGWFSQSTIMIGS